MVRTVQFTSTCGMAIPSDSTTKGRV
jgi:hypothetical protein